MTMPANLSLRQLVSKSFDHRWSFDFLSIVAQVLHWLQSMGEAGVLVFVHLDRTLKLGVFRSHYNCNRFWTRIYEDVRILESRFGIGFQKNRTEPTSKVENEIRVPVGFLKTEINSHTHSSVCSITEWFSSSSLYHNYRRLCSRHNLWQQAPVLSKQISKMGKAVLHAK